MRLSTRDHYTSSTLIGGKGRAGPSSLHTTLETPTQYVNARWMEILHRFPYTDSYMALNEFMFHDRLDYVQKPPLGGRPNPIWETLALRMLTIVNLFYFIMCEGPP